MKQDRSSVQDAVTSLNEAKFQLGTPGAVTFLSLQQGFDSYAAVFQAHFAKQPGVVIADYNAYRPVYRYGHDLGMDERYCRAAWTAVEQAARGPWEARNPDTWAQFRDMVRFAWETTRVR